MVTSLVAAESLLLVLLTVFVVALLRSHAQHQIGFGLVRWRKFRRPSRVDIDVTCRA